jgi:alkylhydroperoxidase family enzyme
MTPRLENPFKAVPQEIKAMTALEASLAKAGLDHGLLGMVKLRASQINACAYCIRHVSELVRNADRPGVEVD